MECAEGGERKHRVIIRTAIALRMISVAGAIRRARKGDKGYRLWRLDRDQAAFSTAFWNNVLVTWILF